MEEQEIGVHTGVATSGKLTCIMWLCKRRITMTIMDFVAWLRFLRNAARRSDEIIVVNPACTEDFTTICIDACCVVIQFPYAWVLLHVGLCQIFLSTWNWPKCWVKPVYVIYTLLEEEEFRFLGSIPLFAELP